eukprot:TRINITY_DN11220_c0_g1_i1.p1 TRINITY_DN11220_c0_g1~~TRINITY_DN11220_c0_g1_i1.p1  ORF type:complete len:248 (+),score=56.10 TRINITY_DN11220_c0_g1_i1:152-895(+)
MSPEEKEKFLQGFIDRAIEYLDNLGEDEYLQLLEHYVEEDPDIPDDERALEAAQQFLERCMADPSYWAHFEDLPEDVKRILLDRFIEQHLGTLDAFKRLTEKEQKKLLAELLKHNCEDIEAFARMTPEEREAFMNAFVQKNFDFLHGLTPEEYEALCAAAMRKYKTLRVCYIPPSKPPTVRPEPTGGPYAYAQLRYREWLPIDVPFDQRELYMEDEEFEKYVFYVRKMEFFTTSTEDGRQEKTQRRI